MPWTIQFSRKVAKDASKIKAAKLENQLESLSNVLRKNSYELPYKKLSGNLQGYYSRRINIKHRLVYSVNDEEKVIRVISIWSHYE